MGNDHSYIDDFVSDLINNLKSDVKQKQKDLEQNIEQDVSFDLDDLIDLAASTYVRDGANWVIDLNTKDDEELAEMVRNDHEILEYIIEPSEMLQSLCDLNKL